jgi:hypothetical protein
MYNTGDGLAQGDLWIIEGTYERERHGSILLADGPPLERRQPTAEVALGTTPALHASFPLRHLCRYRRDNLPGAIALPQFPPTNRRVIWRRAACCYPVSGCDEGCRSVLAYAAARPPLGVEPVNLSARTGSASARAVLSLLMSITTV